MARILIVEDEERIASFVSKGLAADGHRTTAIADGRAGLDHALSGEFDLMVLDIGLPGMDGYQVVRRLRTEECCKNSLIIAISGYGRPEDVRQSREAGFDQHLVKPVDYDALVTLFAPQPGQEQA